jgi:GNAT superfamily N-acetyltransferase
VELHEIDAWTADEGLLAQLVAVEQAVVADEDPTAPEPVADDVVGLLRVGWGLARLRHAVVEADGTVLGYATCAMRDHDNTHAVEVGLRVAPTHRRRGVGTALLTWARQVAADEGRRLLTGGTLRGADGAAFCTAVGAEEALVLERNLSVVADVRDEVLATPVDEAYELLRFTGTCPDELLDGYAVVKASMNDAPQQSLEWEDEVWDAQHVRDYLAAYAARRRTVLVVVARHRATGELAALTEVAVNDLSPRRAEQEDTIVVAAHRGHGLGLAVKADLVRWLRAEHPEVAEVETWNADDNRWMLSVNRALGYTTQDEWAEWQLRV